MYAALVICFTTGQAFRDDHRTKDGRLIFLRDLVEDEAADASLKNVDGRIGKRRGDPLCRLGEVGKHNDRLTINPREQRDRVVAQRGAVAEAQRLNIRRQLPKYQRLAQS